jgi:aminoglycoside phosphotransferase (APT) family kinase protein
MRLSGAAPALTGPLILRVLSPLHDPRRALRERATQNTLADLGFPAPRVSLASADTEILGGAFLVMERRPGRPLLDAQRLGVARLLVDTQLRLHALDPETLLHALEREAPGASGLVTLDGHLTQIESRIARRNLNGLDQAMRWLRNRRPVPQRPRAICHGDFHPLNLLVDRGRVTAVLDWPNVVVADPACDVAATRVILELTPLEILQVSAPRRWALEAFLRFVLARYLAGYRRRRPLDHTTLAYYEAFACMRGLVRAAESRVVPPGAAAAPPNPLDASAFGDRLCARFALLTGIKPVLPPRSRTSQGSR